MSTHCPLSLISKIIEVADICCHGRVVSVLEGGYGKTQKRESERLSSHSDVNSTNNYNLLDKAVFSESVMRHLRALIDPYGIHITCFSFFFLKKDYDWTHYQCLFAPRCFW
jgi:hypothetical protein